MKRFLAFICMFMTLAAQAQYNYTDRGDCRRAIVAVEHRMNQPFYCTKQEDSCLNTLNAIIASTVVGEDDKTRAIYYKENIEKNRISTVAHDIAFTTANGEKRNLNDYTTTHKLLYFNDPDCEACKMVKMRLDTTALLRNLVAQNILTVIAICPLNDEKAWQATSMPSYMVNGRNYDQSIEEEETYYLPTMPQFYLLDSDNKVLVKNEPSLNKIVSSIEKLFQKDETKH